MAGFDDLLNNIRLIQNATKQMGLSTQLTEMFKAQQLWKKNLTDMCMYSEILKGLNQQNRINQTRFTGIDAMARSLNASLAKFAIPSSTLNAISLINKQNDLVFENFRNALSAYRYHPLFSQLSSLELALNGISGQLAAIAAVNKKWNLIEEFEGFSAEASAIGINISNNQHVTKEDLQNLYNLVEKIDTKYDDKDKTFKAKALLWLNIIIMIMTIHMYIDFVVTKSKTISKDDIVILKKEIFQKIETRLKEQNEYRTTNRICKVYAKPNGKRVLKCLPVDFDVIVIQVNHKWVYVSYINQTDNLPETGWVLKKYLSKPK
ncbi:hypothetical protein [Geofilum rhodophaeum]|uniref:hypothetical protein n=1 Tax=Geofilum rhodophaeum TaxID=1965019 RepID=UPI0011BAD4B1|nr:hypothetical protein [Geofilum rhodophaeum]